MTHFFALSFHHRKYQVGILLKNPHSSKGVKGSRPSIGFVFRQEQNSPVSLSEPVGGSAPKFSTDSKGSIFVRPVKEPIVQLCPAQGSPVPTFR